LKIGSVESEKIIIGSPESEKIGSLVGGRAHKIFMTCTVCFSAQIHFCYDND